MSGRIYVFSGPSGAGKSTITKRIRDTIKDLAYSVSHTTRTPRKDETDGIDYHFVDKDTFNRMIGENAFVEWAGVYDDLYGTSFSALENQTEKDLDVILDIDSQGAGNIKRKIKDSILIYILPPSLEILEARLQARATDEPSVIELRIKKALEEIRDSEWYDYMIINNDLEDAVKEAESIILADRCGKQRMLPKIKKMFL